MNKNTWIAVVAVIVVGLGAVYFGTQKNNRQEKSVAQDQMSGEKDAMENKGEGMGKTDSVDAMEKTGDKMMDKTPQDAMAGNDSMTKTSPSPTPKPTEAMQKEVKGAYITVAASQIPEIQKNYKKTVLFFHASWCPYCKAANEAFLSRASEIPEGVAVLKVDYDTEKDLKTKYGITYQHTFVQIDQNGNQLGKWSGGDIDALKQNLK